MFLDDGRSSKGLFETWCVSRVSRHMSSVTHRFISSSVPRSVQEQGRLIRYDFFVRRTMNFVELSSLQLYLSRSTVPRHLLKQTFQVESYYKRVQVTLLSKQYSVLMPGERERDVKVRKMREAVAKSNCFCPLLHKRGLCFVLRLSDWGWNVGLVRVSGIAGERSTVAGNGSLVGHFFFVENTVGNHVGTIHRFR